MGIILVFMEDIVVIHFLNNRSEGWPREEIRIMFSLIDNMLQDLGEPTEISIPVSIGPFGRLVESARCIFRGVDKEHHSSHTAKFLLYNFRSLYDSTEMIFDNPRVRAFVTPERLLYLVTLNDAIELMDEVLSRCPESQIAESIVKHRAMECFADWIAKPRDIAAMLPLAKTREIYKPLINRMVGTPEVGLLIGLAVPEARRYAFYKNRQIDSIKICRAYFDAAARLRNHEFANDVRAAGREVYMQIQTTGVMNDSRNFRTMFQSMMDATTDKGHTNLYDMMRKFGY